MKISLQLFILMPLIYSCQDKTESKTPELLTTKVYEGRTPGYNTNKNLYFGDLHVHTGWSFDAFVSNVRVTPDEAYQFAKGMSIQHVSGKDIQIQRPLDFMAVADHAEYMGALIQMSDEESNLYNLEIAEQMRSEDRSIVMKAMRGLQFSIATNWPNKKLIKKSELRNTWQKMVAVADDHYEPGTFTTFPAYEWTSSPAVFSSLIVGPRYAQNMHRNVIFRGGKVSQQPFSSFDSQNPEDLWEWMEIQREQKVDLFAIPHNANISDGRMYALSRHNGHKLTTEYAQTRMANEPVNEVVQIKGQSMAHPILSPNDEFSDFEVYPYALGQGAVRKELEPKGAYVREAFKNGLMVEKDLGINPFQFGIIGSSDSHNGGPNTEEDNNIGRSGTKDHTPQKRLDTTRDGGAANRRWSVAGLAAVWAEENTRESIFDAFIRKEVYATSGPRIRLRFFASEHWTNVNIDSTLTDSLAYAQGSPMGSVVNAPNDQLTFYISAIKDPDGANLDRVQVVKGWFDDDGETHEKIYNVAWSDDRSTNDQGRLEPVANTVNPSDATYTNDIGSNRLQTFWKDPEFDHQQSAFYYVRVLEIPTPRWTTYDAVRIGQAPPDDVPFSIQERAWSSPIWIQPQTNQQ